MRFEEALKALEKIVQELEKEDLPLEEALARFEEGIRLARDCHRLLEEAERRVQVLLRTEEGEWTTLPFESSDLTEE